MDSPFGSADRSGIDSEIHSAIHSEIIQQLI
jgi:hypothetical protein